MTNEFNRHSRRFVARALPAEPEIPVLTEVVEISGLAGITPNIVDTSETPDTSHTTVSAEQHAEAIRMRVAEWFEVTVPNIVAQEVDVFKQRLMLAVQESLSGLDLNTRSDPTHPPAQTPESPV